MSIVDDLMALADTYADGPHMGGYFGAHRAQLRAALESALQAEYERGRRQGITDFYDRLVEAKKREQAAEPVAWAQSKRISVFNPDIPVVCWQFESSSFDMALYTSPPKREPLTAERIRELVKGASLDWQRSFVDEINRYEWLSRAIERAHGIGDE